MSLSKLQPVVSLGVLTVGLSLGIFGKFTYTHTMYGCIGYIIIT